MPLRGPDGLPFSSKNRVTPGPASTTQPLSSSTHRRSSEATFGRTEAKWVATQRSRHIAAEPLSCRCDVEVASLHRRCDRHRQVSTGIFDERNGHRHSSLRKLNRGQRHQSLRGGEGVTRLLTPPLAGMRLGFHGNHLHHNNSFFAVGRAPASNEGLASQVFAPRTAKRKRRGQRPPPLILRSKPRRVPGASRVAAVRRTECSPQRGCSG